MDQAQIIAGLACTIISSMNEDAAKMEKGDLRARLMAAAERLAGATENLVEAAKVSSTDCSNSVANGFVDCQI